MKIKLSKDDINFFNRCVKHNIFYISEEFIFTESNKFMIQLNYGSNIDQYLVENLFEEIVIPYFIKKGMPESTVSNSGAIEIVSYRGLFYNKFISKYKNLLNLDSLLYNNNIDKVFIEKLLLLE